MCTQSVGLAHLILPGEGTPVVDGDWAYPAKQEEDIVWTSLFTGAQCVYLQAPSIAKLDTDALS